MKTSELREFPGNADQEDETVMNFQPGVTPITLELQHGGQKHSVSLPTNNLDKSKKYYVTFTVNKPPQDGKTGEEQPQKVIVQAPHKAVEEGPYKIFDRANAKMGYFDRANAQKGFPLGNRSSQDPCKIFAYTRSFSDSDKISFCRIKFFQGHPNFPAFSLSYIACILVLCERFD